MSIGFIGYACISGDTGTLTDAGTPLPGDLIIVSAGANGGTVPSLPAGWANLPNGPTASPGAGANAESMRCGYRIFQSGDTTTGTWTGAAEVGWEIWRGVTLGATAVASGTAANMSTPAITLGVTDGTSWVTLLTRRRGASPALAGNFLTAVCGTNRSSGAANNRPADAGADSNGGVSSYAGETFVHSGVTGWVVFGIELQLTPASVVSRSFAGTITPVGTLTKLDNKPLGGSITPAGAVTRRTNKGLAGSLTPAGSLLRATLKNIGGALAPAGVLSRETRKTLGGSLTPTGSPSFVKLLVRSFTGAITPSGALSRLTSKPLGGQVTPSGSLTKEARRTLTGQIVPTGLLVKSLARVFAGAMTPAGDLTRQTRKAHGGSIAPSGVISRSVARSLGGAIQPVGNLAKEARKMMAGAIASSGTVSTLKVHFRNLLITVGVATAKWVAAAASLKWFPGAARRGWDSDDADAR